jgi:hypothetical protein
MPLNFNDNMLQTFALKSTKITSWKPLEPSWNVLEASWRSWARLEASWANLDASWKRLGGAFNRLKAVGRRLGQSPGGGAPSRSQDFRPPKEGRFYGEGGICREVSRVEVGRLTAKP